MLYLIDTAPWGVNEVERECAANSIEFRGGFFFADTCTKLASHLAKQQIAHEFGGTSAEIERTPEGKPYFKDLDIHFSITHHNRLVIAVASRTQPVGIDLTDAKTPFSNEELERLFTAVPEPGLAGYYWAAREAFLKYTGVGTQEAPLSVQKPAHTGIPDLESLSSISVMPFMRVERTFVRLFKVRDMVGAVIAPREDITEICGFSSEIEQSP